MNGYSLDVPDTPAFAQLIVLVITHELSELDFEKAIRPFVNPLSDADADAALNIVDDSAS